MASIFKRPADRKKRNIPYWIQYTDHEGKRRTEKGFSDRGLTEQLAAKLENEAMLRRRGLLGPEEGEFGRHRRTPIEEHLRGSRRASAARTTPRST
jgi:integrase/recombinase XerD